MAEEQDKEIGKKCAHSGVALKRSKRYYRNGLYFLNKASFKSWQVKQQEASKAEGETKEAAA